MNGAVLEEEMSSKNVSESGDEPEGQARKRIIYRVTLVGFVVNLLLTVGKLGAGFVGRSGAMVADAVHSLSDFGTDIIVLAFVGISARPKDESHEWGHGKFEAFATIIIASVLFAIGAGILLRSIASIREFLAGATLGRPGAIALAAAVVSIVSKELLYRYTIAVGRRVNSTAVVANAWHHRSDAFSSVGTLIGIGGAYLLGERWRVLDPAAALIVSLLILKVSWDMARPAFGELMDRSLSPETEAEILSVVRSVPEVREPHNLKTRKLGAEIAIEVHIRLDRGMSVECSHAITESIEAQLRERFGCGTQVIVHVEPERPRN